MNAGLHSPLSKFHPNSALQIKNSAELLNLLPLLHTVTLYFPSPLLLRSQYFTLSPTFFYRQMTSLQSSRTLCFLVQYHLSLTPTLPSKHTLVSCHCLLSLFSVFKEFINFILFMSLFICRLNCLNLSERETCFKNSLFSGLLVCGIEANRS
jgi:hypothetical protein